MCGKPVITCHDSGGPVRAGEERRERVRHRCHARSVGGRDAAADGRSQPRHANGRGRSQRCDEDDVVGRDSEAASLITNGPQRHRDTENPFSKYFSKKALVSESLETAERFLTRIAVARSRQEVPWQPRDVEERQERIGFLCVSVSLWPVRGQPVRLCDSSMGYRSPLETRLAKKTTKAIVDFNLIEDGDRVMVGLSGGKDSWALIQILDVLRKRAPIKFSIVAVNVDSGYEGYQHKQVAEACRDARVGVLQRAHQHRRRDRRQARKRRDAVFAVRAVAARRAVSARRAKPARPRSRSATISTTSSKPCC